MVDRVRELLDRHYDAVFTASCLESHEAEDTPEAAHECKSEIPPLSSGSMSTEPPVVPPRRRGAYRVDPRVLEAHTTQRYETFRLPRSVTDLLRVPRDENDWLKAEQLAAIVHDLADGCVTLYLQPLAALHGAT